MASIIRCKACGAPLEFAQGEKVCTCKYCQSVNTLAIPENGQLYNRANELRNLCEFDRAIQIYEQMIEQDPQDAESYFGLVLCKYGIEYVQDPSSGKRIPTCRRLQMIPMAQDEDFKKALQYADDEIRWVYQGECAKIDKILSRARILASSGEKFDVFISYKETDDFGNRTEASVIAQDLYERLTRQGYRVFFARKTLESMAGVEYEPVIYCALHSAKVMLLLGTNPDQFQAVWVKNEWSRYLARMNGDPSCRLIPLYKGMKPEELPNEVKSFQAIDMEHIGFEQDVTDAVARLVKRRGSSGGGQNVTMENIRHLGYLELEKKDFNKARELFGQALLHEPEDWQSHMGRVLCAYRARNMEEILNTVPPIDYRENGDYQMMKRFAPQEQLAQVKQWEQQTKASLVYYSDGLCKKGEDELRAGRFKEAKERFTEALKYNPGNYRGYLGKFCCTNCYHSWKDMTDPNYIRLPDEGGDFYKAMELAGPQQRAEMENSLEQVRKKLKEIERKDITSSWMKVILVPLIFVPIYWMSVQLENVNAILLYVESDTFRSLLLLAWWFLGPILAIIFSGSAKYEQKRQFVREDGTIGTTEKKRKKLRGGEIRTFLHMAISIGLIIVCYSGLYAILYPALS